MTSPEGFLNKFAPKDTIQLPEPHENVTVVLLGEQPIKSEMLQDVDAICFGDMPLGEAANFGFSLDRYKEDPRFAEMFKQNRSLRFYSVDTFATQEMERRIQIDKIGNSMVFDVLGFSALLAGLKGLVMDRRHFLRSLLFTGVGGYFSQKQFNVWAAQKGIPQMPGLNSQDTFFLARLRNLIRAHKADYISSRLSEGSRKPKMLLIVNAVDSTVQDAFKIGASERAKLMEELLATLSAQMNPEDLDILESGFYRIPAIRANAGEVIGETVVDTRP